MRPMNISYQPAHRPRPPGLNIPGASVQAVLLFPVRLVVVLLAHVLTSPLLITIAMLRALYLRIVKGKPSQILKFGRHNAKPDGGTYSCQQLYSQPLDEARLRNALIPLCAEDGIAEADVDLKFLTERPNDWPTTGSWDLDHFIESTKRPGMRGRHYMDYFSELKGKAIIRIHVWNGEPGKPTVIFYSGNGASWDGSSNYNFFKELMNRYVGNPPNQVFQQPELSKEAAQIVDNASFSCFFLRMPFVLAFNWFFALWNFVRAARWAGGNGLGFKIAAMNFDDTESKKLLTAAKKIGVKPFAVFTFAAAKACDEVLGQMPRRIIQQSSIQTRHYPLPNQQHRDLVGDWLFGPAQVVPTKYGLAEAMAGYNELITELDELGPNMRDAFMAKAYGVVNSGAAAFEIVPTYNTLYGVFDRTIFMNNYGVRTMPQGSHFHTWNWNAPLWFGVNTINVDGRTTTLLGSVLWGLEVVEALRDNMEATIRDLMEEAGPKLEEVPSYAGKASGAWSA